MLQTTFLHAAMTVISISRTCPEWRPFEGTWRGEYQGKLFAVVKLRQGSGVMSAGLVRVDADGDVTGVVEPPRTWVTLREVAVSDRRVRFKTGAAGSDAETDYELTLGEGGVAKLRIVDAHPMAKAFELTRVAKWLDRIP